MLSRMMFLSKATTRATVNVGGFRRSMATVVGRQQEWFLPNDFGEEGSEVATVAHAKSKRTGVLATKIGMMPVWDEWGFQHGCTVLQVEECYVVANKTEDKHGYTGLQLGAGLRKFRNVKKPVQGQYKAAGLEPKRSLQEFRVTEDALLPVGTQLTAEHFVPGQYVDVCGKSKGKGFQGVMKRHNFAGQQASHGNSKTHRHPGSTGQNTEPARVFKGKKMAGNMGNQRVTRDNLYIHKIDPVRNLIYVKGSVPGGKGSIVRVTDARKKPPMVSAHGEPLPFPTCTEPTTDVRMAPATEKDPFAPQY